MQCMEIIEKNYIVNDSAVGRARLPTLGLIFNEIIFMKCNGSVSLDFLRFR